MDLGPRLVPVAIRHARLGLIWRVTRALEDWTTSRYYDAVGTSAETSSKIAWHCVAPGQARAHPVVGASETSETHMVKGVVRGTGGNGSCAPLGVLRRLTCG